MWFRITEHPLVYNAIHNYSISILIGCLEYGQKIISDNIYQSNPVEDDI